jgi:hypothetical protein
MPERTTVSQHVQIGVETTEGTAVAANKQLQALSIALTPQIETNRFRPMGTKLDTLVVPGKDWTKADLSGVATYDEIIYPLASALVDPGAPTTTGTTGKLYTYEPSAITEDTVKTYTVEQGSAVRAQKAAGLIVTDLGIKWDRNANSVDLSGSGMAQQFTDGITLTATPTSIPLVPILPKDISVYADTTAAGLGTTKLLRPLSGEFALGGRFGPLWVLNAALASYAAHVELAPDITLKLLLEADAAGMGYLTNARAGTSIFVRIEAVGAVIGAGPATYKATFDFALKVESVDSLADVNGVYAVGYSMRGVYDATWAKFLSFKLINSTTSL